MRTPTTAYLTAAAVVLLGGCGDGEAAPGGGVAGAPATAVVHITSAQQFDALVAASATPVIVDLSTTWCPPCKQFAPVLERFTADHSGTVAALSVDIEAVRELGARFQVEYMPTVVRLTHGKEDARFIGTRTPDELAAWYASGRTP